MEVNPKSMRNGIDSSIILLLDRSIPVFSLPNNAMEQPTTRSRALPSLMEELVEEILLHLPPEEPPAHLVRAAMVCKAWCRILSDAGFRRRYYRFHRGRATPTLLGYVCGVSTGGAGPQFVPTTSYFLPPPLPTRYGYSAMDCRHGRVLIRVTSKDGSPEGLIVCSLVTGNRQHLSFPPNYPCQDFCSFTWTVLCARHRHGCDHLDCHGGPFLVVYVQTDDTVTAGAEHRTMHTRVSVYSSEAGAWSAQTCYTNQNYYHGGYCRKPILIGDALYFILSCDREVKIILKYDLCDHGLSVMDDALQVFVNSKIFLIDIDGGLGILEFDYYSRIYMWSRHVDANGVGVWARHNNVVDLETSIPRIDGARSSLDTIHFAEGTDTILLYLHSFGIFALDLNSRQLRTVNFNKTCDDNILPYVSFYIPDLAKGKLSSR
ncbi:unnamed protein product [Urochloa decumbens]|uniref:F-box domain-containing protein n=1 Tax=Urochloa decumbens TaxID=240449 RepID=A0ABC9A6L6_9POAL